MLRHYFSLAFPVLLSAVAALSFLHLRREGHLAAAPVLQVAQADPADPFAPPKTPPMAKPVVPAAPAEAKPIDPVNPPGTRVVPKAARPKRVRREVPKNDDEVRTPFLRSLLGQLDSFTDVSGEDRDGVRQMIYDADVEMSDSMGPNARRKIEAANQKRGFVVGPSAPRTATDPPVKRKDVLRPVDALPPGERPQVERPAAPAPPPEPKKDVFDDLFKKE